MRKLLSWVPKIPAIPGSLKVAGDFLCAEGRRLSWQAVPQDRDVKVSHNVWGEESALMERSGDKKPASIKFSGKHTIISEMVSGSMFLVFRWTR